MVGRVSGEEESEEKNTAEERAEKPWCAEERRYGDEEGT
jgi:hypothetical protein